MQRFDAPVERVEFEGGARLGAFELSLLIVGVAKFPFHGLDQINWLVEGPREIETALGHMIGHIRLGDRAVVIVKSLERTARIALFPNIRNARDPAGAMRLAVGQGAVRFLFTGRQRIAGAQSLRAGEAWNGQIVIGVEETVEVIIESLVAAFNDAGAIATTIWRGVAAFNSPSDWCVDACIWNAVINHIHDSSNRGGAIEQRSRPTHDFNFRDRQRVLRHGVVGCQVGDIHVADAVLQQADMIGVQPANDWPAGVRTEIR